MYVDHIRALLQVFSDFLPHTVFPDSSSLLLRGKLGDGGFGAVYRATVHARVSHLSAA